MAKELLYIVVRIVPIVVALSMASPAAAQGVVRVNKTVQNGQWQIEVLSYERSNQRVDHRVKILAEGLIFWKVTFRFLQIPALAKRITDVEVRHRLEYELDGESRIELSRFANVKLDGAIELLFALPRNVELKRLTFNAEVTPKYRRLWMPLPAVEFPRRAAN